MKWNLLSKQPVNVATLAYLPPVGKFHSEVFQSNLESFKSRYPVYFYGEAPRDRLMKVINNPEAAKTIKGSKPYSVSNLLFLEALRLAVGLELTHFIYLESDSRVGCDYWDEAMFKEYRGWKYAACAGTPVFWNLARCDERLMHRLVDYAYRYQRRSHYAMLFCQDYGLLAHSILYPNGSVSVYSVAEMVQIFGGITGDLYTYASLLLPWDMHVGLGLWRKYGIEVFERIGFLTCTYSGFGNLNMTEGDRIRMLETRKKVAVHQIKTNYRPKV